MSWILAWGTTIFIALGEHSFSIVQVGNIPWSKCVLLTSPYLILNIK